MLIAGLRNLWTLGALAGAWTCCLAQEAPPTVAEPSIDALVQDLGADDVMVRVEAQRKLTENTGLSLRELEVPLKAGKLQPEQRVRLLVAANARFCSEPRAAMGIQPSNIEFGQHGLVLGMIIRGFPSRDVLRVNDRLLSVDDQAINDISDIQRVVFAHDPGDEVSVVLMRDGATLHLRVKLGKYEELRQAAQLTAEMLDRAWDFRMKAYPEAEGNGGAAPIDSGISEADWKAVARMDIDDGGDPSVDAGARMNPARFQDDESRTTELVAAGEPRGAMTPARLAAQGGMQGPNFRPLPGDAQVLIGPRMQDAARREVIRQLQREDQIRSLRRIIDQNTAAMKDLPEEKKQAMARENQRIQLQIDQLEGQRVRQFRP